MNNIPISRIIDLNNKIGLCWDMMNKRERKLVTKLLNKDDEDYFYILETLMNIIEQNIDLALEMTVNLSGS